MLLMVLKTFHFDVALRKLEKVAPNHLSRKILEKFIKKRSKAIEGLLETKMQDDCLHVLKKYLKDVSYSLEVFHGRVRDYRAIVGVVDKRELVALTDGLNDYLDWVVGLAILKISLSGKLSTDDKKKLRQIRKKWLNKKIAAKRRVIALIHS